jgi:hypothetical protein
MANNTVMIHEPTSALESTQWVVKILDAKYEKANLNAVVNENFSHLISSDQEKVMRLLTEFEELFDGILGDWNTEPCFLMLRKGAQQYHSRPFPTPKSHKETLIKGSCETLRVRGTEVSAKIRMDFPFVHGTKTEPYCVIHQ